MIIELISKKMAERLIVSKTIEEADRELYEYAVYCLLLSAVPLVLTLVYGMVMQIPYESICFIFPFMCMRKYAGGYHAHKAGVCLIGSSVLLILGLWIVKSLVLSYPFIVMVIASLISIIVNSPIDSDNKRLTKNERKHCRYVLGVYEAIIEIQSIVKLQLI